MRFIIIFYLCVLTCSNTTAQIQKKMVTAADHHLWSTVSLQEMSTKGSWLSYRLQYEEGADTLIVRSKNGKTAYGIAKGYEGKFIGEHRFVCRAPGDSLVVLHLGKGSKKVVPGVVQYELTQEFVVYIDSVGLKVSTFEGAIRYTVQGASSFVLNPARTAMVYNSPEGVTYMDMVGMISQRSTFLDKSQYSSVAWQKDGSSFAFLHKCQDAIKDEVSLSVYHVVLQKRYDFNGSIVKKLLGPKGSLVPHSSKLEISDDGTKVFFTASANQELPDKNAVQVWNASDRINFYAKENTDYKPRVFAWWPESDKFLQLTDHVQSGVFLTGDDKHAVTFDMKGTRPEAKLYADTDYYITELATGKRKLFLSEHSTDTEYITASPSGRYVAYMTNSSWWLYDIRSDKHQNIGSLIGIEIAKAPEEGDFIKNYHAIAGWTPDDTAVIITDEFDLWQIDLKKLSSRRITTGRENEIVYRPHSSTGGMYMLANWDGLMLPVIDKNPMLLRARGKKTKDSGFFEWNGKVRKIVYESSDIPHMIRNPGSEIIYYTRSKFDEPPSILVANGSKPPELVFQSNPHHSNFHWGKSEVINYKNSHGVALQGALYYPANYNRDMQYPMVVYIYDRLSSNVHQYVNPTLYNSTGFNIANLVSQGFFVLCPDIEYTAGDVGVSAAECTIAATKKVISMGMVDAGSIALVGHSFGGYEVAFIMTQTELFATAIVGAAITDLVSAYLGMGGNIVVPDAFRFEVHQFRMGQSFYDDKEGYLRNSPVMHAEKINKPLLLFSGTNDKQVNPMQTMELYLALWKLRKKAIMLLYPGERHIMLQKNNKADLTIKYGEWLAHFLKKEVMPDWMKSEFSK